jgi:hypothetical protein
MKVGGVALGLALAAGTTIASAGVTESQYPPRTVRDLIEICVTAKDDPMMTAAINYCHGFAQGAVTKFIAWANALPSRLDEPAVDGMFIYLAETYPCPREVTGKRRAR